MPFTLLRFATVANFRLLVFFLTASTAGLAGLIGGWKAAVLVPLVLLLGLVIVLHCFLRLLVAFGLRAYGRGELARAALCLAVVQLPQLRRYTRRGKALDAFHDSKSRVAAQMMTSALQGAVRYR